MANKLNSKGEKNHPMKERTKTKQQNDRIFHAEMCVESTKSRAKWMNLCKEQEKKRLI